MSSTNFQASIIQRGERQADSQPRQSSSGAIDVRRLFPQGERASGVAPELEPLAQILATSRSMVLARLISLRLMSDKNPERAELTRSMVNSAQKMLLVEEEIVDTIVTDLELGISSGASYCVTHLGLHYLQNAECTISQNPAGPDRWELLISELIHNVQGCANYVQRVVSSTADRHLDFESLGQLFCRLMHDNALPAAS